MATTKQLNINNRTYYFYNDLINLKDFDPKLLKLDKKGHSRAFLCITLDILEKNLSTILAA